MLRKVDNKVESGPPATHTELKADRPATMAVRAPQIPNTGEADHLRTNQHQPLRRVTSSGHQHPKQTNREETTEEGQDDGINTRFFRYELLLEQHRDIACYKCKRFFV